MERKKTLRCISVAPGIWDEDTAGWQVTLKSTANDNVTVKVNIKANEQNKGANRNIYVCVEAERGAKYRARFWLNYPGQMKIISELERGHTDDNGHIHWTGVCTFDESGIVFDAGMTRADRMAADEIATIFPEVNRFVLQSDVIMSKIRRYENELAALLDEAMEPAPEKMTEAVMRKIVANAPYDEVEESKTIREFYRDGNMSLAVHYDSQAKRHVFNIYCNEQYVGIEKADNMEAVIAELVDKWNRHKRAPEN